MPVSKHPVLTLLAAILLIITAAIAPQFSSAVIVKLPNITNSPADDAMSAQVTAAPQFRKRLEDSVYTARAAAALKSFKPDPQAPFAGAIIIDVEPNSPAAQLGFEVGDIICTVDDQPAKSDAEWCNLRNITIAQTLKLWSTKTSTYRSVKVDVGHIGIETTDWWVLQNQYMHSIPQGERPNDDLLVAACAAQTDADLAETALFRANANTPIGNFIAEAVSYYDSRYDDCLAYARSCTSALPASDQSFAAMLAYRSALATFRWPMAAKLAKSYPNALRKDDSANPIILTTAINEYRALPPDPMTSPADAFTHLNFQDRTRDIANSDLQNGKTTASEWAANSLRHTKKINFKIPDGHYNCYVFGPSGANVDFQARCHFRATDKLMSNWAKSFQIALDTDGSADQVIDLTMYIIDGKTTVTGPNLPACRLDLEQLFGNNKSFTVHVTAVGGQFEFSINNHRIFHGPLPLDESTRRLCISLIPVGVTGGIDKVSWKTADARALGN